MYKKTRIEILAKSNITKFIDENKNINFIRQELNKQYRHKFSYSVLKHYIEEKFKKIWKDKKWIDIKNEVDKVPFVEEHRTKSEKIDKGKELSFDELDKKLLAASYNLDVVTKEEIISYLQTILKNTYNLLSKIKHLEKRVHSIETKINK